VLRLAFILAFILAVAPTVLAATINIDPGPIGLRTPKEDLDMPFADLNGTPFAGQELSLDFIFNNKKWISTNDPDHGIIVILWTNYCCGFIQDSLPGTASLLNEDGAVFHGPMDLTMGGSNNGGRFFAFVHTGPDYQPNPIDGFFKYGGVRYDVTLPDLAGVQITGAQLRVTRSNMIGVPEPSMLPMLLVGLCGLCGLLRFAR
jgi:hypothetical protein